MLIICLLIERENLWNTCKLLCNLDCTYKMLITYAFPISICRSKQPFCVYKRFLKTFKKKIYRISICPEIFQNVTRECVKSKNGQYRKPDLATRSCIEKLSVVTQKCVSKSGIKAQTEAYNCKDFKVVLNYNFLPIRKL